jgi:uncharacterized protein YjiS (DUF1127 family)
MSTVHDIRHLIATTASTPHATGYFNRYWHTYREWRRHQRLRSTLYNLADRELKDIGITRGEIEYVVLCEPCRAYPRPDRGR